MPEPLTEREERYPRRVSRSYRLAIILGVALSLAGGAYASSQAQEFSIPNAVSKKYQEMAAGPYGASLGVTLSRCTKGNKIVYKVGGSGGFTIETFY